MAGTLWHSLEYQTMAYRLDPKGQNAVLWQTDNGTQLLDSVLRQIDTMAHRISDHSTVLDIEEQSAVLWRTVFRTVLGHGSLYWTLACTTGQ